MNESDLERALRDLRPTADAGLESRIADALAARTVAVAPARAGQITPRSGVLVKPERESFVVRFFRGLGWATAGAAATVAMIAWFHETPKPREESVRPGDLVEAEGFQPAESARELVEAADDGVRYTEGEPMRQVRYIYIERYAWKNPVTGATVEVEVPREDVMLTPVAMQ